MSSSNPECSTEFVSLLTKHQPDLWSYIITLMPGDADTAALSVSLHRLRGSLRKCVQDQLIQEEGAS